MQASDAKDRSRLDSGGDDISNYSYDGGRRSGMHRNSYDSQNSNLK